MSRQKVSIIALTLLVIAGGVTPSARTQENSKPSAPTQVFVVNTQSASVSLVDLKGMKETRQFQVGPRPYGVAVSLDGKTVAVGVEDEEKVKFYDTTDFKLKGEARIGQMFNDHMTLTPDGKHFLVANFYSDDVVAFVLGGRLL